MVTAMGRHAASPGVQEKTAFALRNLAVDAENRSKIGAQVELTHGHMRICLSSQSRARTHTHAHTYTGGDRGAGRGDGPPPCERRGGARACGLGPLLSHHRVSTDNVFCEPWFCPVGTARCNQGLESAHQAGGGIGGRKARHGGPWRHGKHHGCWSDLSAHLDCFEYDLRSGPDLKPGTGQSLINSLPPHPLAVPRWRRPRGTWPRRPCCALTHRYDGPYAASRLHKKGAHMRRV